MKKIFFFFLFILFFNANSKADIAYIDIDLILNKSKVGKFLNNYVDEINSKNISRYTKVENRLLEKEQLLIAQQNILNKEEFEKQFTNLSKEVQTFRTEKRASLDKLKKFKIENTKEILKVLNPIITNYVNFKSISIVIPKKNIIVGKKNLDITDDIIELLDKDIQKLNF
tara:strand:+ start:167 stop:676 length:510 start_codon:yes stop_codon:yes gene_type:complete